MARLAAVEKGEYYPTPLSVVDTIAAALDIQDGTRASSRGVIRLFDPCAGEGLALERLAGLLRQKTDRPVETWGVEISPDRARQAATRLDTVVEAPFESTAWSPSLIKNPISLAWLNAPYDGNGNGGRLERDFVERVTAWLGDGHVLVLIVPWKQMTWGMCQHLAAHYRDVEVFRFPDETGPEGFDRFGQIVVLATRDTGKGTQYTYPSTALRTGEEAQELYYRFFPRQANGDAHIRRMPTAPNGHRYTLSPVGLTPRLRRKDYTWEEIALACADNHGAARALFPDHAEMDDPLCELNVGHVAQVVAGGLLGTLVAQGKAFKGRAVKVQEVIPDPVDPNRETVRDRYETHIACLSGQGYVHLSAPHQVAAFLKAHADLFRQHVRARFHPYGTEVQDWEWDVLGRLSLDKQLPGRAERGLFEKQKRAAVALTRAVKRYGVGHMVAEMGTGKTRTALAALELMHARHASDGYPALISCPPHLVEEWVKEAEGAIPGLKAVIVETIAELEGVVARYRPGDRLAVVVSHSRIKMGPGWTPAYNTKTLFVRDKKGNLVAKKDVPVCPGCGKPVVDGNTAMSIRELEKRPLTCRHTVPAWNDEEKTWEERPCATPLYQFHPVIARRWPLADYVAHRLPAFFKVFVFDELHKAKSKDTDIAHAFQTLARVLPTITLTGTFFGGLSSSIFYLLYHTQKRVRDEYAFDGERSWVEHFGVLETVYQVEEGEFGAQNARRRRRLSTREQPGLAPTAIRFLLPTTVFGRISELGMEMPACSEEMVPVELGFLNGHIDRVWGWTWDEMTEHWPVWTSAWLQWNLARPNSAFRNEVIASPDDALDCPAQVKEGELLPKEQWLVDTVRAELAQGRKTIVYPRQTGTRDIRGRLKSILGANGIADVAVLDASVDPRRRSAWLSRNAGQVLITNPRLVETGLNLHTYGYCTIIFVEVEYSLYTLWQSMSRVWRPGQTKKVKIFFAHYPGTLEEKALARAGKKLLAGKLLYGEDVSSALVEDAGDASLVVDLIRAIKDGEDLRVDADTQIFGVRGSDLVTESLLGSPTVRSRALTATEQWLRARGLRLEDVKATRSRRKKVDVPENQMSLFDLAKAA